MPMVRRNWLSLGGRLWLGPSSVTPEIYAWVLRLTKGLPAPFAGGGRNAVLPILRRAIGG